MIRATTEDAEMRYDVFISYSHRTERFPGPNGFVSGTGEMAGHPIGTRRISVLIVDGIQTGCGSKWIAKELTYWRANRSTETLLIALTDGDRR